MLRKLKLKWLNNRKFRHYFFYGFGEIIIVVIGILIALKLNAWSENNKTQRKINSAFEQINTDLNNNINRSITVMNDYLELDSVYQQIREHRKNKFDYRENDSLIGFGNEIILFDFNNKGFNDLLANVDDIPTKYSLLYQYLQHIKLFYELYEKEVDQTTKMINDQNNFLAQTKPWFSMNDSISQSLQNEYAWSDPFHHNFLFKYDSSLRSFIRFLDQFQTLCSAALVENMKIEKGKLTKAMIDTLLIPYIQPFDPVSCDFQLEKDSVVIENDLTYFHMVYNLGDNILSASTTNPNEIEDEPVVQQIGAESNQIIQAVDGRIIEIRENDMCIAKYKNKKLGYFVID